MSHEDEGHYKAKHPEGTEIHPEAAERIKQQGSNSRITCAAAHDIAAEIGISPGEIGKTIDLMEIRITECQLGLFGYITKKRSIVTPAETVQERIKARLIEKAEEERISCLSLWQAAEDLDLVGHRCRDLYDPWRDRARHRRGEARAG